MPSATLNFDRLLGRIEVPAIYGTHLCRSQQIAAPAATQPQPVSDPQGGRTNPHSSSLKRTYAPKKLRPKIERPSGAMHDAH